ncbi:PREDICTED: polyvinylalcohol dehydrogenase-like [Prunus mume]|uniref:Polyvinylalcohol dehydrogenase-like n=1 Tax=Prunus mume TaxID=102107 RepID=A0ABM1LNQ1_PRUMU|nr:PREDICTED: polyvinylalcohol dehydrogenase-like [Prunus mume]
MCDNNLMGGGELKRLTGLHENSVRGRGLSKHREKSESCLVIMVKLSRYGTLYFPSWNGFIYVVKASDGSLVWKKNLHALTGFNATGFVLKVNWTVSRSTPTVVADHDLLIVGIYGHAVVIALQRSTGKLIWSTLLDTHAASLITMSGTYYKGSLYMGTASLEETLSNEECCTFRGSFAKLDVKSGTILWQTFVLPDNHGKLGQYSGAAIWGSSPSIDVHRKQEVGPGGITGGGTWGAATDKKRVYTNIADSEGKNFTLKPSNNITTAGGWVAMDSRSGKVLWSTVNPSNATSSGTVSVANGVLFAGSTNPKGSIYAMNTRTGKILWSNETGATVYGGMSISNGCIYVGNGYDVGIGSLTPTFTGGTSLFAFCVT